MIRLLVNPATLRLGYWDEEDDQLRIAARTAPILSSAHGRIASGRNAQALSGARGALWCDSLLSILDGREAPLAPEWGFDAVTLLSAMLYGLKVEAEAHGLPSDSDLALILPDGTGPDLKRSVQNAAVAAGFRSVSPSYVANCIAANSDANGHLVISFDDLALTATLFGADPLTPIEIIHRTDLGGVAILAAALRCLTARLAGLGLTRPTALNQRRLRQAASALIAALEGPSGISSAFVDFQGQSIELYLTAGEIEAELHPYISSFADELGTLRRRHDAPRFPTIYSEGKLPGWLTRLVTRSFTGMAPRFVKAQQVMEGSMAASGDGDLLLDAASEGPIGIITARPGGPSFDPLFDAAHPSRRKVVRHYNFRGAARLEVVRKRPDQAGHRSLGILTFPEYSMLGWPIQFEFALNEGGVISVDGSDLKSGVTVRRTLSIDDDPLGSDGVLGNLARDMRRVQFVQASL